MVSKRLNIKGSKSLRPISVSAKSASASPLTQRPAITRSSRTGRHETAPKDRPLTILEKLKQERLGHKEPLVAFNSPKKQTKVDPYKTDEDNPEWTEEDFKKARPAADVFAEHGIPMPPRPVGRPTVDNPKKQVTIRLDADVVKELKSPDAKGWQTRANQLLRDGLKLK
jgi:uncharacterized protein (DUF4415 family)